MKQSNGSLECGRFRGDARLANPDDLISYATLEQTCAQICCSILGGNVMAGNYNVRIISGISDSSTVSFRSVEMSGVILATSLPGGSVWSRFCFVYSILREKSSWSHSTAFDCISAKHL